MNSNILFIETSGERCAVALSYQGQLFSDYQDKPRYHNRLLIPMIRQLLEKMGVALWQLDALAYSCGPGSFVGIRLGASVIQGLAYSASIPVIPISSLQVLALSACQQFKLDHVLTMIDAHMGEVYFAAYYCCKGSLIEVEPAQSIAPELLIFPKGNWSVVGRGWQAYQGLWQHADGIDVNEVCLACQPDPLCGLQLAEQALLVGGAVVPEKALPIYLQKNHWRKR